MNLKEIYIKYGNLLLVVLDILVCNGAYFFTLLLRFDLSWDSIDERFLDGFYGAIPYYSIAVVVIFILLKMYSTVWEYAGGDALIRCGLASILASVANFLLFAFRGVFMPRSYFLIGLVMQASMVVIIRFSIRLFFTLLHSNNAQKGGMRVMLVGAGTAGVMLARDMKRDMADRGIPVCFVDDDGGKKGKYIEGIPVLGNREDIPQVALEKKIDSIYICIPSMKAYERKEIINVCSSTGCKVKIIPGIYQLINGEVGVEHIRDVAIEDLLGRDSISIDMKEVYRTINGKRILITGGGGSIGSELCKQIASHSPRQIIIFDMYENNVYDLEHELRRDFPNVDIKILIGSVRDSRRMLQICKEYRPQIIFHAAAHKHVPLMEDSPCEAIKNNAIGTYKCAFAALVSNCERFILISTDKAVNPTNIMGASKRICEMIIQTFARAVESQDFSDVIMLGDHEVEEVALKSCKTGFVAVRFGNVLGSNGSVIPLFKKQIEEGGPVTVTHPDIVRYFMTIPEAVSLVLQASTYAKGGEIFVLDMGSPIKIVDLARNLISAAGLEPDKDIKIKYTGLRPGEKLYEEKLMDEEGLIRTDNELIHIGAPLMFDRKVFMNNLREIMDACRNQDEERAINLAMEITGTYTPERRN